MKVIAMSDIEQVENNKEEVETLKNEIKLEIIKEIDKCSFNNLVKKRYKETLNHIFKYLDNKNIQKNKVYLDYQLWNDINDHTLIKKNSILVHNFTKFLKSKHFITSNSKLFPRTQVMRSINPLSKSFLNTNFSNIDDVLDFKDELVNKINSIDELNLEKERLIYIFFRLFIVKRIPIFYYKYFRYENIFHINDKVLLIIKLDEKSISNENDVKFTPLKMILFSKEESEILKQIFKKDIQSLSDYNDYLFLKDEKYYENELRRFCTKNSISIKAAKNVADFCFLYERTPLELTLYTQYSYPQLSLFEIDKLYPKVISRDLLDIEKQNLEFYRNSPSNIDDVEPDLDEQLANNDYEIFEKFKTIKKVNKAKYVSKEYLQKWYSFCDKYKENETFSSMVNYVKYLLNLANREINKNAITSKTLQAYLQRIFDYCFTIIMRSNDLEDALIKIDEKLKKNIISSEVYEKYEEAINKFLSNEYGLKKEKINNTINFNRSIVFEDELKDLVLKIKHEDISHKNEVLKLRRQVYVILAFYTGLRKSELQTRLVRDFSYLGNNSFQFYVNKEGFRKSKLDSSLKNANAKRRVEFTISNKRLFKLVKEYYDLINKNNQTFVFPDMLVSKHSAKKRVIKTNELDKINKILQKVTKRYTTLHSFRHTYATNEVEKLLEKDSKSISDIFDLCVRLGHSDFETTLKRYLHIDLLNFMDS